MNESLVRIEALVHDLKGPLAIAMSNLTMLMKNQKQYGHLSEKQINLIERAMRANRTCQGIVENLLEMGRSRDGSVNTVRFRLGSLIIESILGVMDIDVRAMEYKDDPMAYEELRKIAEGKNLFIHTTPSMWSKEYVMDFGKLKQIIRNILSNAFKFRKSRTDLSVEETDDQLVISVKDDGPGIPPVYHDQIFQSYFQMDQPFETYLRGHGLGLAAVAVLVKDMKGKVALNSGKGCHTEFLVQIPVK